MNRQQDIIVQQFNMGGIADSRFSGIPNSVYKLTGFDPHSLPGVLRVAQKMVKETNGTVPDEFCKARVTSSNGRTYWGSSESGKIWEMTSGGAYTLVHTIVAGAGSSIILGMYEYQGYIYVATSDKLHRILASSALGAAQWTANLVTDWATFTAKDTSFKPMIEQNLVLYIGDGKYIAQVDAGTFSATALDVASPLRIKSLGKMGTRVLAGTYVADNITKTEIVDWDTFSDSFRVSDTIDEVGINAFLEADNYVYAQCGLAGNIYVYDGEKLNLWKKIPGDYSPTAQCVVHSYAVANLEGQILFGMSNVTGNPCDQGLYRIARNSSGYPYILDLPYPISERSGGAFVITGIEIGAVVVVGSNVYMSWKNGSTKSIDKLDYSTKLDGAYLETRVSRPDRFTNTNFPRFEVAYYSLPIDTAIAIAYKKNYATDYVETTEVIDPDKNLVIATESVVAIALQVRLTMTASANTAPETEALHIAQS